MKYLIRAHVFKITVSFYKEKKTSPAHPYPIKAQKNILNAEISWTRFHTRVGTSTVRGFNVRSSWSEMACLDSIPPIFWSPLHYLQPKGDT